MSDPTRLDTSITAKRDRALKFIASRSPSPGQGMRLHGVLDEEARSNWTGLFAATNTSSNNAVTAFLEFLINDGFVYRSDPTSYTLNFAGWRYLESLQGAESASQQAFVAMWFNDATDDVYAAGIAPAIRESGYDPLRIDQKDHVNKIDDEIILEIRRSKFIVADFTSEPHRPRGGVYFEAGMALGLGKPVIWCCHADLIDQVHFDTRQFNHITWSTAGEMKNKLRKRIGAVIGDRMRA